MKVNRLFKQCVIYSILFTNFVTSIQSTPEQQMQNTYYPLQAGQQIQQDRPFEYHYQGPSQQDLYNLLFDVQHKLMIVTQHLPYMQPHLSPMQQPHLSPMQQPHIYTNAQPPSIYTWQPLSDITAPMQYYSEEYNQENKHNHFETTRRKRVHRNKNTAHDTMVEPSSAKQQRQRMGDDAYQKQIRTFIEHVNKTHDTQSNVVKYLNGCYATTVNIFVETEEDALYLCKLIAVSKVLCHEYKNNILYTIRNCNTIQQVIEYYQKSIESTDICTAPETAYNWIHCPQEQIRTFIEHVNKTHDTQSNVIRYLNECYAIATNYVTTGKDALYLCKLVAVKKLLCNERENRALYEIKHCTTVQHVIAIYALHMPNCNIDSVNNIDRLQTKLIDRLQTKLIKYITNFKNLLQKKYGNTIDIRINNMIDKIICSINDITEYIKIRTHIYTNEEKQLAEFLRLYKELIIDKNLAGTLRKKDIKPQDREAIQDMRSLKSTTALLFSIIWQTRMAGKPITDLISLLTR